MRKIISLIVSILLLFDQPALAGSIGNVVAGSYQEISSSTNVMPVDGALLGVFVSSASNTPTITVYDSSGTSTATVAVGTFTPAAATYYPINIILQKGAYIVIGGTVTLTAVTVAQ